MPVVLTLDNSGLLLPALKATDTAWQLQEQMVCLCRGVCPTEVCSLWHVDTALALMASALPHVLLHHSASEACSGFPKPQQFEATLTAITTLSSGVGGCHAALRAIDAAVHTYLLGVQPSGAGAVDLQVMACDCATS